MKKRHVCGRCHAELIDVGDMFYVCPHCDTACTVDGCESCVRSSKGSVPRQRK